MVDLVCAARSPDELAREFEPTAQSICAWVATRRHADRQAGRREAVPPGLATAERDKPVRLRRTRSDSCASSARSSQKPRPRLRYETVMLPSGSSGS